MVVHFDWLNKAPLNQEETSPVEPGQHEVLSNLLPLASHIGVELCDPNDDDFVESPLAPSRHYLSRYCQPQHAYEIMYCTS